MTRPTPALPVRRHGLATLAVAAFAVLALTGCAAAAPTPVPPGVAMMDAANGVGMMGDGAGVGGGRSMMTGRLTCTAPAALPGARITVTLVDMGMMRWDSSNSASGVPMRLRADASSVPAGQVSFVARNVGTRIHELVILPLSGGQSPGAFTPDPGGTIDEAGSIGEASQPCRSGSGDGLTAGTSGWVTLTLAPGRYALVCNEADHYADGMWAELDVT